MRRLPSCCRHADAENAFGPTEMYALSRPHLGSEKGARRAQSLSSVCDRRRGERDQAA
jgi:hypothetical protein